MLCILSTDIEGESFFLSSKETSRLSVHLYSIYTNSAGSNIVESFKDRYLDEETPSETEDCDRERMPLEDVMSNWFHNLDETASGQDIHDVNGAIPIDFLTKGPIEELEDEEEILAMPEIHEYQNFIINSPAYDWLLATLRKEFLLAPAEENLMDAIKQEILLALPSTHTVSRKKSPQGYNAIFRIRWDPLTFVKEQDYGEKPGEALERAITLTGSASHAQALTCGQYLRQTWPSFGAHIIQLFKDMVRSEPGNPHTCKFPA